jgi:hypothetical protein
LVSPSSSGSGCRALGFPGFSLRPEQLPTADRDAVNPGGVRIMPLAIGLFAAGATWVIFELFGGTKSDLRWFEILDGLGAGALSFALATALGSR